MERLREKLFIGDYYQYFNYPVRKQIVQLYKNNEHELLEQVLTGLIHDGQTVHLAEDVQIITLFDSLYPAILLETYDPPLILYAQGDSSLLRAKQKLALIGARFPRAYSVDSVKKIMNDILEKSIQPVIVSGLAKGVDGLAHQLALAHDIPTIAVLGHGFQYIYPREHEQLAQKIRQKGLLLSEYPPHVGVNRWQFVARNRIIAGLCQVVIIVEAKEKSGSLITAELALAENREVFIVSGKGFDQAYEGSHLLVQEGARLLLHIEEVFDEYKIK